MCEDLRELLSMTILRENQARWYFKQILEASVCCDLQVDLETNEIKIIDFGLASEVQYDPYNMFRGEKYKKCCWWSNRSL